ncbi:MAG: class II fructose-bisphosphate aldolase [Rhizobiaceae bacterium]
MTVATLADVLIPAMREDRAVLGLVVLGWEEARAFVEAADETGLPVILQAGPGCRKYMPTPILGKMFRHLAEQSRAQVVCHIDHAYTLDECREGIDHGFSSVMIDGSRLPIGDNVALTAKVVAAAKPHGVSVEGEVGFVGYVSGESGRFTDPEEARQFDEESGADALAISVGNVHLNTEKTNGINMDALRAIEAVTRLPLVLHGGSGIPCDVRKQLARTTRVSKFNIGTELRMAFGNALRKSIHNQPDEFDHIKLLLPAIGELRLEAAKLLKAF